MFVCKQFPNRKIQLIISYQMFSLIFMFLCSIIEELCTKEENDKTSCNFNFGHECIIRSTIISFVNLSKTDEHLFHSHSYVWIILNELFYSFLSKFRHLCIIKGTGQLSIWVLFLLSLILLIVMYHSWIRFTSSSY